MCHYSFTCAMTYGSRPRACVSHTHVNESCHLGCLTNSTRHELWICNMTHSYVPWLIDMCHDSPICNIAHSYVSWLIHLCIAHTYVPWLICMCHDSFICAMTHSYVPWLIHMCPTWSKRAMNQMNEDEVKKLCAIINSDKTTKRTIVKAIVSTIFLRLTPVAKAVEQVCLALCCSVLQCDVSQCICSVLQCVAVCRDVALCRHAVCWVYLQCVKKMLQCGVLQRVCSVVCCVMGWLRLVGPSKW